MTGLSDPTSYTAGTQTTAAEFLGPEEYLVLTTVAAASGPVGARAIKRTMRSQGLSISESTASRIMRRLDQGGLTRPVGSKGRILTQLGSHRLAAARARAQLSAEQSVASDVRNLQELVDLLSARRAVDREAARGAALRATEEDIASLGQVLDAHCRQLSEGEIAMQPGLEFHRIIGRACGNRMVTALQSMLLDTRMDHIEAMLDVILGSHHTEEVGLAEHQRILEAIAEHDARKAEAEMQAHMSRLIDETARYTDSDVESVVERMLMWARSNESTHQANG